MLSTSLKGTFSFVKPSSNERESAFILYKIAISLGLTPSFISFLILFANSFASSLSVAFSITAISFPSPKVLLIFSDVLSDYGRLIHLQHLKSDWLSDNFLLV